MKKVRLLIAVFVCSLTMLQGQSNCWQYNQIGISYRGIADYNGIDYWHADFHKDSPKGTLVKEGIVAKFFPIDKYY